MKKLFFLILLIGIVIFSQSKEVKAQPELEISTFSCPDNAAQGTTVNVSATCKNVGSGVIPDAYNVYLAVSGNPTGGIICTRGPEQKLAPNETIDCSGSFTMGDVKTYIGADCSGKDSGNNLISTSTGKWVTLSPPSPATSAPAAPTPAAPGKPCPAGTVCIPNPLAADTFEKLIDNLITFIFWIALALFPLMIVIAGIYFVTAAGNPEQIEKAKSIILYTLIGFIVILVAKGFIELLKQVLEVKVK